MEHLKENAREFFESWEDNHKEWETNEEKIAKKIDSAEKLKEIFNSPKSDKTKVAYLLKNLIVLDKLKKIPTAKELTLEFFNSNIEEDIKIEVANYILKEKYMCQMISEEFGTKIKQNLSPFMKGVIELIDEELSDSEYIWVDFNFVRRETILWLITNNKNPKEIILSWFKEKLDWFDFPTQNGILDYCYKNEGFLGRDFVMSILNKAVKINMREVRITALRYAYLLTNDDRYLEMMKKDNSIPIRKMAEEFKQNLKFKEKK